MGAQAAILTLVIEGQLVQLALYRKYRSSDFSQVIGQPHVVETLIGAIKSGHISHAYLFTGPRGTGKTSVARLLARSINCLGETKPCNECVNCKIEIGSNLDLIEIDAASNRSIDEVRDLRDKIRLAPAIGKYKVYIIDEVHMLTKEAFNALLKTLEEPPSHAIFILATTEAHKLPETIISRTQRFNFKPINNTDLSAHLRHIAKIEKIIISDDAINIITLASRGGFRDGISMLDQAASLGYPQIAAKEIRTLLGWADHEAIDELSAAVAKHNAAGALEVLNRLLNQGAQPGQIINQLINHWRDLLVIAIGGQNESPLSERRLLRAIETLMAASLSNWPALALETSIIRLCLPAEDAVQKPTVKPTEPVAPVMTPAAKVPSAIPAKTVETSNETITAYTDPKLWQKSLMIIKQANNSLYALLCSCLVSVEPAQLLITCRFNFHRDRLQEAKNRQIIEQTLAKVYGQSMKVVVQVEAPSETENTGAELIGSALEILGGEVIDE